MVIVRLTLKRPLGNGVANSKVSLENKNATVELSRDISYVEFKEVTLDAGYGFKNVQ